jgi:hypothetical protein
MDGYSYRHLAQRLQLPNALPGPHHCIGTARAVTDVVFRSLRAKCTAAGGTLSMREVEDLYANIIGSFSSGYDMFETVHHNCMAASLGIAEMPFARDRILATLLRAGGEKSARHAFALQVEFLGPIWLGRFFDGFAQFVRQHHCNNADIRLINAYVDAAASTPNSHLSIEQLLQQDAVHAVLHECVQPFAPTGAPNAMAKPVCDAINANTAAKSHIAEPHVSKITEDQARRFLRMLPRELQVALTPPAPASQALVS